MAKKSCVIYHLSSADESKEFKIKTKAKVFIKEIVKIRKDRHVVKTGQDRLKSVQERRNA